MLEVNNEVSAEAVFQSVMTVTDFHLEGVSKKTYKTRGAGNWHEENVLRQVERSIHKAHMLYFLSCIHV